ncbi:MAG: gamma-glutamyltransferase [Bacteroidetes bacterium MedPE-SWsnd-G2]|nr:MAG: gamma-glutamyltransferase [Bacteroidetes bacterium MedPE-SWsnd-G2]
MIKNICLTFLALILFFNCSETKPQLDNNKPVNRGLITKKAMVVSARQEASKIGSLIMQQGGNAFDAMMATEMALAVTFPSAGNLGGGGFLVFRLNDGTKGSLDYREKAPISATTHMYLDTLGEVIPHKSSIGPFAVGVPGTIAGIFEAQKTYGLLEVSQILKPVIELAQKGYIMTKNQAEYINNFDSIFLAVNKKPILYTGGFIAGDTLKNIKLAETLKRISENGVNEFYTGKTAELLTAFIQDKGGIITLEDLKAYKPIWREPISFSYKDYKITSMGPPSSGGICLGQILKMVEPYPIETYTHNSVKTMQVITEAERRSYADRSFFLGDPDFVKIPDTTLLSEAYLSQKMNSFSFEKASSSSEVSHGFINGYESPETTHYSIVDPFGNAIAVTTTLNASYGSKLFVDELGFFLNNEMDDFSSKPGVPNFYGLIGAEANKVEPQKRMLSSMTPTIVEKDNKLVMTVGTPGGSTIITSVAQTLINVIDYNMSMHDAVNAPRFHHQWLPDYIRVESGKYNASTLKELQNLGYNIDDTYYKTIGRVDGILVLEDSSLEAGADSRGDDTAYGF